MSPGGRELGGLGSGGGGGGDGLVKEGEVVKLIWGSDGDPARREYARG